jgi:glutathione synthase/RimK-type ligase-like ATP-grasp enzyme
VARLAVFTERYTIRSSVELTALTNFRLAAFELGHELDFVFKNELKYLSQYDAVLIRALTDPLNTAYVVARWAEMMGKRVLDTSESIRVCCDKVNMYRRLQRAACRSRRPASSTRGR